MSDAIEFVKSVSAVDILPGAEQAQRELYARGRYCFVNCVFVDKVFDYIQVAMWYEDANKR